MSDLSETENHMSQKDQFDVLWNEYQYRHEHCWKLVFQLTGAAVALAVVPYLKPEIAKSPSWFILTLPPLLAVILLAFGFITIKSELQLLDYIRDRYRQLQRGAPFHIPHPEGRSRFTERMKLYFKILITLAIVHFVVTVVWICRAGA